MADHLPFKSDADKTSARQDTVEQTPRSPVHSLTVDHDIVPSVHEDTNSSKERRAPSVGQLSMYSRTEEITIEKRSAVSQPSIARASSLESSSQTDTISMIDVERTFSETTVLKSMAGAQHKVTKCQHCVSPVLEKKASEQSLASSGGSWESQREPKDGSELTKEVMRTILDTNRVAHVFRSIACQTDYSWLKHAKRVFMPPRGTPFQPSLERVAVGSDRRSSSTSVTLSDTAGESSSSSESQASEVSSTSSVAQITTLSAHKKGAAGKRSPRRSKSKRHSSASTKKRKSGKRQRHGSRRGKRTPEIRITESKQSSYIEDEESDLSSHTLRKPRSGRPLQVEEMGQKTTASVSPTLSSGTGSSTSSSKYRMKIILDIVKTVRYFQLTLKELQDAAKTQAEARTFQFESAEEDQQVEGDLTDDPWKGWRSTPGKEYLDSKQRRKKMMLAEDSHSSDDENLTEEERKRKKANSVAKKAQHLHLSFEQLIAASEDTTGRKCDILINIFDPTGELAQGSATTDSSQWSLAHTSTMSSTTNRTFSTVSDLDEVEVSTTLPDDENFIRYQEQLFWRGGGVFEGDCEYCGQPIKPFPTKEQVSRQTPSQLYCCLHYRDFVYSMIRNPVEQWIIHHDAMIDVHKHDKYDASQQQQFDASYYSKLAQKKSSITSPARRHYLGLAAAPHVLHKARAKTPSSAKLQVSSSHEPGEPVTVEAHEPPEGTLEAAPSGFIPETSSVRIVKATERMHKREIIRHKHAFESGPSRSPEMGKNFIAKGKNVPNAVVKFSLEKTSSQNKEWLVKNNVLEPIATTEKLQMESLPKLPSWVQLDDSDEERSAGAQKAEPKFDKAQKRRTGRKFSKKSDSVDIEVTKARIGSSRRLLQKKSSDSIEDIKITKARMGSSKRLLQKKTYDSIEDDEITKARMASSRRLLQKKSTVSHVDGVDSRLPSTLATASAARLREMVDSKQSLLPSEKGSMLETSQSKVGSVSKFSKTQLKKVPAVPEVLVPDKIPVDLSTLEPFAVQAATNLIYKYYKNGKPFAILFPNGTGNIFYPDGKIAISVVRFSKGVYGYFVNTVSGQLIAVLDNIGHTGVDFENTGKVRLCLSQHGGLLLKTNGARKQRWLWHAQTTHVHAPPIQPLSLAVTKHVELRVEQQDSVTLTFRCYDRCVRFQTGALLKVKSSSSQINEYDQLLHIKKAKIQGVFNRIARLLRYPRAPTLEVIRSPLALKSEIAKLQALRKAVREELLPKCHHAILWR